MTTMTIARLTVGLRKVGSALLGALVWATSDGKGKPNWLGLVLTFCVVMPFVAVGVLFTLAWTAVLWGWGKLTTTGGRGEHA